MNKMGLSDFFTSVVPAAQPGEDYMEAEVVEASGVAAKFWRFQKMD